MNFQCFPKVTDFLSSYKFRQIHIWHGERDLKVVRQLSIC